VCRAEVWNCKTMPKGPVSKSRHSRYSRHCRRLLVEKQRAFFLFRNSIHLRACRPHVDGLQISLQYDSEGQHAQLVPLTSMSGVDNCIHCLDPIDHRRASNLGIRVAVAIAQQCLPPSSELDSLARRVLATAVD
jgi:hypothetical protein